MEYRCANTDRISHLPSEIIQKILHLLPCRDAVRTSILSSDWRYKWMSMTDLSFGFEWSSAQKCNNFIYQCLYRHKGPIRKFSVRNSTRAVSPQIKHWMELVSKHDIEELQLFYGYSVEMNVFVRSPSYLFSCKKLTHLELNGCLLDVPPTFEGFMNLKVLILSCIKVKDNSSIESLISKSPLLESLSLHVLSCGSNIPIIISSPTVKYFSMQVDLESIRLEKSPVLVDTSLCLYRDSRDCDFNLSKILSLGGAPNLEKLAVRLQHILAERVEIIGCYRGVLSTTFSHLKVLTLGEFYLGESKAIPLVIELLRSAPNLEKLAIYNIFSHSLPNEVASYFWQKEYLLGHCFMKLKVVELDSILCKAPEIEFVKFILSNSPFLEKMTIKTRETNQEILTRMSEKLSTLPHASTQVALTFHDGDSRWRPNRGLW